MMTIIILIMLVKQIAASIFDLRIPCTPAPQFSPRDSVVFSLFTVLSGNPAMKEILLKESVQKSLKYYNSFFSVHRRNNVIEDSIFPLSDRKKACFLIAGIFQIYHVRNLPCQSSIKKILHSLKEYLVNFPQLRVKFKKLEIDLHNDELVLQLKNELFQVFDGLTKIVAFPDISSFYKECFNSVPFLKDLDLQLSFRVFQDSKSFDESLLSLYEISALKEKLMDQYGLIYLKESVATTNVSSSIVTAMSVSFSSCAILLIMLLKVLFSKRAA